MMHSDARADLFQFCGVRHVEASCHKAPAPDEWGGGDIESAAGFTLKIAGLFEQFENGWADTHGFVCRARVDAGDFARWPVETEARLKTSHFGKGFLTGSAEARGVLADQGDFEARRHGVSRDSDGLH
jgi:hypothetical protein